MSVLALTGGVGGAKLALGLYHVLPPAQLSLVVNTADDMRHLGLCVSPDIDTLIYTLAGLVNTQTGWGRQNETWSFMQALPALGGTDWFRLGDADLAMHVLRTQRLSHGESLTEITLDFGRRLGLHASVLPMTDDIVATRLQTEIGELDFQDYFVAHRCQPAVQRIRYEGAEQAQPSAAVVQALRDPGLEAVLLCPSNPWLSLAPMLALPALRQALRDCHAPVVAVSPLVGGKAVKGPTDKVMAELGLPASALPVAQMYADFLDGFVLDTRDAAVQSELEMPVCLEDTLMHTLDDRLRVARSALAFARQCSKRRRTP